MGASVMAVQMTTCPGCGLEMPLSKRSYDRKFHASAECWSVFEEVLAVEFQNAVLFGQVHQLTVDAYAVQHAGGQHPDKSVDIHLCGLHLTLVESMKPVTVPPILQRIASTIDAWPHFAPPARISEVTVCDVALSKMMADHIEMVKRWARLVWSTWTEYANGGRGDAMRTKNLVEVLRPAKRGEGAAERRMRGQLEIVGPSSGPSGHLLPASRGEGDRAS